MTQHCDYIRGRKRGEKRKKKEKYLKDKEKLIFHRLLLLDISLPDLSRLTGIVIINNL